MKPKRGATTEEREEPTQGRKEGVPSPSESPSSAREENQEIPRDPDAVEAEIIRLRSREEELLRALAEMTNVQRRRKLEAEQTIRYAQESLIRELLPVLDDFERALAAMPGTPHDPLHAGVELVRDRMMKILEKEGLTAIRPAGQPFDPNLHDAIGERPAPPNITPGTVLEVAQPGYSLRDRVLRHAKVVVAGAPANTTSSPSMRGGASLPPPDTIDPPLAEADQPGASERKRTGA